LYGPDETSCDGVFNSLSALVFNASLDSGVSGSVESGVARKFFTYNPRYLLSNGFDMLFE
jgi:hypothetical protein